VTHSATLLSVSTTTKLVCARPSAKWANYVRRSIGTRGERAMTSNGEPERPYPGEFVYWVFFETAAMMDNHVPVVFGPPGTAPPLLEFDSEMVAALDAIEYCLRLPRSPLDTLDLGPTEIDLLRRIESPHRIVPLPWKPSAIDYEKLAAARPPVIILTPEALRSEVEALVRRLGLPTILTLTRALDEGQLCAHWTLLCDSIHVRRKRLKTPPQVANSAQPLALSYAFLERQLPQEAPSTPRILDFVELSVRTQAAGALGEAGARAASSLEIREAVDRERPRLELHAAWGAPGHAPAQIRSGRRYDSSDRLVERRVYEILVRHRAAARTGLGFLSSTIPDEAFAILDQLERHCQEARGARGKVVWRLLRSLGGALSGLLTEDEQHGLKLAHHVAVFSPFPLGLTILPGEEVPMACTRNVACHPVAPLTRALQMELLGVGFVLWRAPIRVLIAECLDPSDRIAKAATAGWGVFSEVAADSGKIDVDIASVSSERELAGLLTQSRYDMLVLSGHGSYNRAANVAGIVIGGRPSLLLEIGEVPPVVLLSACHVAPRARGVVTVADLLLRHGAVCVLATLVPVDVRKNALLMVRLVNYLTEALAQREDLETLADVWRFTMASNAVNEVLDAVVSVRKADARGDIENSVMTEFMLRRSPGRLRAARVYTDTIAVLQEILDERDQGHLLAPVARAWDFLPESLLYVLLGDPECIRLRPVRGFPTSAQASEDAADGAPRGLLSEVPLVHE
jgi:CHAT domain-containing protein